MRRLSSVGFARQGFAKLKARAAGVEVSRLGKSSSMHEHRRPRVSPLVLFLRKWECVKGTEPIQRKVGRRNAAIIGCFRAHLRGRLSDVHRHGRLPAMLAGVVSGYGSGGGQLKVWYTYSSGWQASWLSTARVRCRDACIRRPRPHIGPLWSTRGDQLYALSAGVMHSAAHDVDQCSKNTGVGRRC